MYRFLSDAEIMCYVIITARSLLWTLLTIASTLAMLTAVMSPYWLYGAPRVATTNSRIYGISKMKQLSIASEATEHSVKLPLSDDEHKPPGSTKEYFCPTVGIFNRCTRIKDVYGTYGYNCAPFVRSLGMPSDEFPEFWKVALFFFGFGLLLMTFTVATSVIGCCKRAIAKKSIFTISGTVQAVAGLFYILGLVFYPAGWGSKRIYLLCGAEADYYTLGDCTLGWAFYCAIAAIVSTFICSVLSVQAEISTSSDKVQDEIFEGKNPIFLL